MNGVQIAMANGNFDEASECSICLKNFHPFRHKHRCKSCGQAVCRSCASSQKKNSRGPKNDSLRICDRCVQREQHAAVERSRMQEVEHARARQLAEMESIQRQAMETQRQLEAEAARRKVSPNKPMHLFHTFFGIQQKEAYNALVARHFGSEKNIHLHRRHSFNDKFPSPLIAKERKDYVQELVQRADEVQFAIEKPSITQVESVSEECAICLEILEVGNAIYTTACGHSFHWSCLKEIKQSSSTNSDQCPSCRSTMTEVQIKKKCDHPRVRVSHKFCRDCGDPVTAADIKPRPDEVASGATNRAAVRNPPLSGGSLSGATYRAGSQGALVQCPQCRIEMRVLPHMYNMRVACPQGHMFQVQVAPSSTGSNNRAPNYTSSNNYPGSYFNRG
ncbi:hypothetical protein LEN26_000089 [Aphanomyces euteiches]|nr:hypothetical protein AeMF1_020777 [Aphanomyces euteiches]KAH9164349.1 hypothetical protein LEN26_000089 [Aphanomyces euteiches]KAH9192696.1 hypothetical protein AeNC1_005329 [Aphanomyces euteiches]